MPRLLLRMHPLRHRLLVENTPMNSMLVIYSPMNRKLTPSSRVM